MGVPGCTLHCKLGGTALNSECCTELQPVLAWGQSGKGGGAAPFTHIHQGHFPELHINTPNSTELFHNAHLRRDVTLRNKHLLKTADSMGKPEVCTHWCNEDIHVLQKAAIHSLYYPQTESKISAFVPWIDSSSCALLCNLVDYAIHCYVEHTSCNLLECCSI